MLTLNLSSITMLIVLILAWVLPLLGVVLGAYAVFRTKTVGTGARFLQPIGKQGDKNESYSYAAKLYPEYREIDTLRSILDDDEALSAAARRIREQKKDEKNPTLEDHIREVEGK